MGPPCCGRVRRYTAAHEYRVSVEEGRARPGFRLVLTRGVPGPWGELAKAILHVKRIARGRGAGGRQRRRGARALDRRRERADRRLERRARAHGPQRHPVPGRAPGARAAAAAARRARAGALPRPLGRDRGRVGLRLVPAPADGRADDAGGAPSRADPRAARHAGVALRLERSAGAAAPGRCAEVLGLLAAQLHAQAARGSRYLLGDSLSVADLSWATFAVLVRPYPHEVCPMPAQTRAMYEVKHPPSRQRSTRCCSRTATSSTSGTSSCRSTSSGDVRQNVKSSALRGLRASIAETAALVRPSLRAISAPARPSSAAARLASADRAAASCGLRRRERSCVGGHDGSERTTSRQQGVECHQRGAQAGVRSERRSERTAPADERLGSAQATAQALRAWPRSSSNSASVSATASKGRGEPWPSSAPSPHQGKRSSAARVRHEPGCRADSASRRARGPSGRRHRQRGASESGSGTDVRRGHDAR